MTQDLEKFIQDYCDRSRYNSARYIYLTSFLDTQKKIISNAKEYLDLFLKSSELQDTEYKNYVDRLHKEYAEQVAAHTKWLNKYNKMLLEVELADNASKIKPALHSEIVSELNMKIDRYESLLSKASKPIQLSKESFKHTKEHLLRNRVKEEEERLSSMKIDIKNIEERIKL